MCLLAQRSTSLGVQALQQGAPSVLGGFSLMLVKNSTVHQQLLMYQMLLMDQKSKTTVMGQLNRFAWLYSHDN